MKTAVLIPCYNEETAIPQVIADFRRVLPQAEIYVYDNNSKDRTAEVAKAAGAIHSDFEKKFIRAEVVNWKALVDFRGYPGVREKGLLRLEGKEYIVKDGDVLLFKFNV